MQDPASRIEQHLEEQGYPPLAAPPSKDVVPGGGRFVVPHVYTFSQIVNIVSRSYRCLPGLWLGWLFG